MSLARAVGIPAREITGMFKEGLLWSGLHSWVEPYYYGAWQVWDPAFQTTFEKADCLPNSHYLLYTYYLMIKKIDDFEGWRWVLEVRG